MLQKEVHTLSIFYKKKEKISFVRLQIARIYSIMVIGRKFAKFFAYSNNS